MGAETRSAQRSFRGIYPMMYAYFDANGRIDEQAMRLQVSACIGGGAHGIAVLGLATEVSKLSAEERRALVQIVLDEVAGRVPVAVTVSESTAQAQVQFANWAGDHGASWVILQPPPQRGMEEAWYAEFFANVMRGTGLPCAIQNAPEYLGVGLGPQAIQRLRETSANFVLLKGEGPVLSIRAVIEAVDGRLAVFNGRGGLELPDNLRAGCAGMIPACDTFDYQVQVYEAMVRGDEQQAERIYSRILPAIVFTVQSLDTLVCYGKRIGAMRLGLSEVYDRAPALAPASFGLACARRYAELLGPLTSAR